MGAIATEYAAWQPARRPWWRHLYLWVLVGIAGGVAVGALLPAWGASLEWLGTAFIALVKMIIAPVIFLTVVTGIASSHELRSTGAAFVARKAARADRSA